MHVLRTSYCSGENDTNESCIYYGGWKSGLGMIGFRDVPGIPAHPEAPPGEGTDRAQRVRPTS